MDYRTIALIVIALVVGGYGLVALYLFWQSLAEAQTLLLRRVEERKQWGGEDY